MERKPFYRTTLFQMLTALVLGVLVGQFLPGFGKGLNPLATGFISLVKMVVALLVFATLTIGIAKIGNPKEVGRIGLITLVYFEIVSTIALVLGLVMGHLLTPGAGLHINPATLSADSISKITDAAQKHNETGAVGFILDIIPKTVTSAFADGNLLQVLLLALLFGFALARLGEHVAPVVDLLERCTDAIFGVVGIIMKAAPLAVFGAVAYTVSNYGFLKFAQLGKLVGVLYLSCFLFIGVVLGITAWMAKFNLWSFIKYVKDEAILVYATASSEVALPRLIAKLERAGCAAPVVGFVVPTGYSFNLTGSAIYMTMAALFIAQATDRAVPFAQEMLLLGILLITSKGVAGIPAASLVTLAAALTIVHDIPVAGIALVLGVDRIMDSMRSVTNFLGNGAAALAVAKWEDERNDAQMRAAFAGAPPALQGTITGEIEPEKLAGTILN
jgi:aerobic C4-dicarboxylate transport protein